MQGTKRKLFSSPQVHEGEEEGGELSVDELRQLLELDYDGILQGEQGLYWDDWDRGVSAVWCHNFARALVIFMHSRPPGGLCGRGFQSSRLAVGLVLLVCQRFAIPEATVLQYFWARGARPQQAPGPRSPFPLAGGAAPLIGRAACCAAQKPLHWAPLRERVRLTSEPAPPRVRSAPVQCHSATALVGAALGLPRVVFVDCAADPNRQTGSRLHPFCDVAAALPHAHAGDTLVLLPGHYPAVVLRDLRCPRDAPLHIRGASARAVVVGRRTRDSMAVGGAALALRHCSGLVVSDLTLCGAKTAVHADAECSYLRLRDLRVRGCHHVLDTPDRHNHVIEAGPIRCETRPTRRRRVWDAVVYKKGIAPCLGPRWALLFALVALAVSGAASLGIVAYAERFYAETGDASKVTAWVVSIGVVLTSDALIKQPVLVILMFSIFYMFSL